MPFANPLMLIGLTAGLIPVILHLLNRRRAEQVEWGAMQFLLGSVVGRNRRILLEEALLLALRCLLVSLLAMTMALPFVPPASRVPWQVVLPALLLGFVALGAGTALWPYRAWRWGLYAAGMLLLIGATGVSVAERYLQVQTWGTGQQDIALVIDGSASMEIVIDGKTNFSRAIEEAASVVDLLGSEDSASIIVAGPQPRVVASSPAGNREQLRRMLSELKPLGGSMSVRQALGAAANSISGGRNPVKKIVMFTDGQAVGWKKSGKKGEQVDWEELAGVFDPAKERPGVILRTFPMPAGFRNVQIAELTLSRRAIAMNRPVSIQVRVENTGAVPVNRPVEVTVRVDGGPQAMRSPVRQLSPGESETVTFPYRFERVGVHSVEARIQPDDDMPADDAAGRIVRVLDPVAVLTVEGNPTSSWPEMSGRFITAALAPDPDLPAGADDKEKEKRKREAFVDLTEMRAADLGSIASLGRFSVIILSDVPRLSANAALRLAQFVSDGGGVLIVPGERCRPEFYNTWKTMNGVMVTPAQLAERKAVAEGKPAVRPATGSFQHPALKRLASGNSDISSVALTAYWRLGLDPMDAAVSSWGALDDGSPMAVERRLGRGSVLMTAMALHDRGSNLPSRQVFLPLVHEMLYALAAQPEVQLEADPGGRLELPLFKETPPGSATPKRLALTGQGLRGEYFVGSYFQRHLLTVLDAAVSPTQKAPDEQLSVRWTGSILAPKSETYTFDLTGADRAEFWIDGKSVVVADNGTQGGKVELKAGTWHDVRIELRNWAGPAACQVAWSSPSMSKTGVPSSALSPLRAWEHSAEPELTAMLESPDGSTRPVPVRLNGEALSVDLGESSRSGLYALLLPQALQGVFSEISSGGAVRFAVRSSPDEGRLTVMTESDTAGANKHLRLTMAWSLDEVMEVLNRGLPGHTLWRQLAAMLLVVILLEIALSRWIAVQRKLGKAEAADPEAELAGAHPFGFRSPTLRVRP